MLILFLKKKFLRNCLIMMLRGCICNNILATFSTVLRIKEDNIYFNIYSMTPKCFRRINIGTRTMRMVILIAILIIHFCKGCHVTHNSFLKQQQKKLFTSPLVQDLEAGSVTPMTQLHSGQLFSNFLKCKHINSIFCYIQIF